MSAIDHGYGRARALLDLLERQEDQLRELEPDEHLSMVVDGRLKSLNASRDWTLELAKVEALLAIVERLADLVQAIDPHAFDR